MISVDQRDRIFSVNVANEDMSLNPISCFASLLFDGQRPEMTVRFRLSASDIVQPRA